MSQQSGLTDSIKTVESESIEYKKKQTIPGKSESESFIYPFRKVWFLIVVPKGFRVWCKSIYRHESLSQAP